MMKALRFVLVLLAGLPFLGGPADAGDYGTADEAKAMALRAADYLKAEGAVKAFPAFNTGSAWRDHDLYVFVLDNSGTVQAHNASPARIGENLVNTPDAAGKYFVKEIIATKDQGWVDYKFESPVDGQVHDKTSFIVRVGDYLVGVGAYKY
jgi:Signal transduction histidine kinase